MTPGALEEHSAGQPGDCATSPEDGDDGYHEHDQHVVVIVNAWVVEERKHHGQSKDHNPHYGHPLTKDILPQTFLHDVLGDIDD